MRSTIIFNSGDYTHLNAAAEENCAETSVDLLDALEAESKVALEKLEPFIRNYILDFELGMLKLNVPPWRGLKSLPHRNFYQISFIIIRYRKTIRSEG